MHGCQIGTKCLILHSKEGHPYPVDFSNEECTMSNRGPAEGFLLSFPCRVTDDALVSLATACRRLRRLSVYWNLNVTDATLLAVAASCAGLEALNLSGCKRVTNVGVVAVSRGCSAVIDLDLTRLTQNRVFGPYSAAMHRLLPEAQIVHTTARALQDPVYIDRRWVHISSSGCHIGNLCPFGLVK
jgi:hypothetical protein